MAQKMAFAAWFALIDQIISQRFGIGADDGIDIDYRGLYDAGKSPKQVVAVWVRTQREG